jgi:hypothetical protein
VCGNFGFLVRKQKGLNEILPSAILTTFAYDKSVNWSERSARDQQSNLGRPLLPHSAHLEISAYLKFLQVLACKMGYEVALLLVNQPASQPASHPPTLKSCISQQPLVRSCPSLKLKLIS